MPLAMMVHGGSWNPMPDDVVDAHAEPRGSERAMDKIVQRAGAPAAPGLTGVDRPDTRAGVWRSLDPRRLRTSAFFTSTQRRDR